MRLQLLTYSKKMNGHMTLFQLLYYCNLHLLVFIVYCYLEVIKIKSWYRFIEVSFILCIAYFIWRSYIFTIILRFGILNLLFMLNILWNIIGRKTATEDWKTATVKLLMYNITPVTSINNLNWEWSEFIDFVKCLTNLELHKNAIASEILNYSIKIRTQNLLTQIALMIILFSQKKYGSSFFLPLWLRSKRYKNMMRDVSMIKRENIDRLWHLCANTLWQSELFYSDNCDKSINASYSKVYYETKWGYVYHSKWFYMYINSFTNCSHCNYMISNDEWDD